MTVYEAARQLGEEMLKSSESEALNKAREAFEQDEKGKKLFDDFYSLKKVFEDLMSTEGSSKEAIEDSRNALIALEKEIKEYPVTLELIKCENEFNQYVNTALNIVISTVTGKDTGCSGSCGSCGGCH